MQIKNLKLDDLEVNRGQLYGLPKNPRFIRDEKFEALKKSIEDAPEMLSLRELLVYPLDNGKFIIIGGNMRYRACKDIGYKEVPCKVITKETPVSKLREYAIKDNNEFGQNDWDILANEWDSEELAEWGLQFDWDVQQTQDETEEQPKAVEDDFDEENENIETICKRGDIWRLGEHRLMCGDSTDTDDVARLMDGEKADMVFTDPPYGVSIGDKNKTLNSLNGLHSIERNIINDTLTVSELYPILVKAMTNIRENCKDDASYYVTSPQGGDLGLMMMMMMKEAGLQVRHVLIWCKNSATFSLGRLDYDYQHEPIFYTWTKSHHNYRGGSVEQLYGNMTSPKNATCIQQ